MGMHAHSTLWRVLISCILKLPGQCYGWWNTKNCALSALDLCRSNCNRLKSSDAALITLDCLIYVHMHLQRPTCCYTCCCLQYGMKTTPEKPHAVPLVNNCEKSWPLSPCHSMQTCLETSRIHVHKIKKAWSTRYLSVWHAHSSTLQVCGTSWQFHHAVALKHTCTYFLFWEEWFQSMCKGLRSSSIVGPLSQLLEVILCAQIYGTLFFQNYDAILLYSFFPMSLQMNSPFFRRPSWS